MLLGQFSESAESVVKVGYPGSVLKKVVRYCYTDEVDLSMVSDIATGRKDDVDSSDTKELIHHLLLLADAANYFELTKLRQRIIETTKVLLKEHPGESFWYLEEAKCVGCVEVLQEALQKSLSGSCLRIGTTSNLIKSLLHMAAYKFWA
jgi:hypothetical protein